MQQKKIKALTLCFGIMALLAGCVSQPTLDTSSGAKMSYDGLYPIDGGTADQAWARSDLDLSSYSKMMLVNAGIHYRPVKASKNYRAAARRGVTEFSLTDQQKARLQETVRDAFLKELAEVERFEIVTEPGPDVLMVRGALFDVVSRVPPEPIGRVDVYLESIGQATFVVELIDSQSETVLVRAVDTRVPDQVTAQSNTVTNWAQVRRLAETWARLLRTRLNDLSDTLGIGMEK